jgi:beta-lactamase regulating signal transducer with metallopeptidase domain
MRGLPPVVAFAILTLAWFAAINAVASLAALAAARLLDESVAASAARARRLVALRLAPAAVSLLGAGALFLPAHVRLEAAATDERLGIGLFGLAACGLLLLWSACARVLRVVRASARLARCDARRDLWRGKIQLTEVPLLRGIALAGIIRPRILVGSQVRDALTSSEFDVAVAHERAHQQARDNLTRLLMHCTPDFLVWSATARRLEALWSAEAECLADAAAVGASGKRAERLASALVKIARLAAGDRSWSPEWSTLHHAALLEMRVRLLVTRACVQQDSRALMPAAAALCTAAIAIAWLAGLPAGLHTVTELVIVHLP